MMYQILQHLPLLPSTAHSAASKQQQQAGFGTRAPTAGNPSQQQQQPASQQQHHQRLQEFAGYTTAVHSVYFDNRGLELYHGRLYFRPNTQTLKARWIGHDDGCWAPERVVLERKVYKEGWKGECRLFPSACPVGH